MKTLYVSDLDKTLLRSSQTTSEFTNKVINRLVGDGMIFSFASARSYVTMKKVASGIDVKIPVIIYNGVFIAENGTGRILMSNTLPGADEIVKDLTDNGIFPIVYSYIDGEEKFSYIKNMASKAEREFLDSRNDDIRNNPINNVSDYWRGNPFYITCIDDWEKLSPFYEKYMREYNCVFQRDSYSGEPWLEIMPLAASKANAALTLKSMLGCDKLIAFGDGKNDIDLFRIADECYAVENAVDELKEIATGVIGCNDDDSVAKWLLKNYSK